MSTTLMLNKSERLTVRHSSVDGFEVEAAYAPRGERPPKHVHPHHDETFTVLSGVIRVGISGDEHDFSVGESFEIPRGTVHHMWNPSDDRAVLRWLSAPAPRVEPFFRAMDRLQRAGSPGIVSLAGVLHEYRDVFRPASPVLRVVVRLLGPLRRP